MTMKKLWFVLPVVLLLAASCNKPQPITQQNQTGQQSATQNSSATEPESQETTNIKVAVIALGNNGKLGKKVGCGDSVVYLTKQVPATKQPLNAALKQLFALDKATIQDPAYNKVDLSNIIYNWQRSYPDGKVVLQFERATIENGVAKIYLTGSMGSIGGVCDEPRIPAQIEETAKQFPTVKSVETYLNGDYLNWQVVYSGIEWKTYTNKKYGFQFSYPANLKLKENYPQGSIVGLENNTPGGFSISVSEVANFQEIVNSRQNDANAQATVKLAEEKLNIEQLRNILNTRIIGDFSGDPPWGYHFVYIELPNSGGKGIVFEARTDNADTPNMGAKKLT